MGQNQLPNGPKADRVAIFFCTLTRDSRARSCVGKRRCRAASQPANGVHKPERLPEDARAMGLWKVRQAYLLSVRIFSDAVQRLSVCRAREFPGNRTQQHSILYDIYCLMLLVTRLVLWSDRKWLSKVRLPSLPRCSCSRP